MPTGAALAISALTKRYGRLVAVRDLDLAVETGEIFGFLGVNGAGKSTTIRILLDFVRPTSGRASIFGHDCQSDGLAARAAVGYLPGELGFYEDMTGDAVLAVTAQLSGAGAVRDAYRRELAGRLELSAADLGRRIRHYSTGMKRKLGLVQAFQSDPPMLVLDEPTEGIQPNIIQQIGEVLRKLVRERGMTIVLVEQYLDFVRQFGEYFYIMNRGTVVAEGPTDSLREELVNRHLSV